MEYLEVDIIEYRQISTLNPDGVETKEGVNIFYVYENQIIK
jgi:hypothetical protein